jgi:hypothetical protein
MGNYITERMVENRLSAAVVRRIYDDNNDGRADSDATNVGPIEQLINDAEARFESFATTIYPSVAALRTAPICSEIIRLCLDCAEAMACRRFPKAVNREWFPLWQASERELKGLRTGETSLNVDTAPEPAANNGGALYVQNEDYTSEAEDPDPTFMGGFGLF